jgi:hypothetical protein
MESRSNRSSKSPSHDWADITGRDRLRGEHCLGAAVVRVIERRDMETAK